jgi:hypothetical protein
MSLLVFGTVAYDGITTPSGSVDRVLGGAATHFALAASFFTDVRIVSVVGEDFSAEDEAVLTARGIDTAGIERAAGKSFFWRGEYEDLNQATTLDTQLNVLATFAPKIPPQYLDSDFLFLANIDPALQLQVRRQMAAARLVCGDTMNYWIGAHRANLEPVLRELDVLLINDGRCWRVRRTLCWPQTGFLPWARGHWSSSMVSSERPRSLAKGHLARRAQMYCPSARPHCHCARLWTPQALAIPLLAAFTATWRRSRSLPLRPSARRCSTAV